MGSATTYLAISVRASKRCLVLDTDIVPITVLADVLYRHTMLIHNAGFELRFFAQAGIEIGHFEDTMQAAGLLLGVYRRSLEDAASAYLGIDLPKELQTSDWGATLLSPGQLAYAALDAVVTFDLWRKLRVELVNKGRRPAYSLQRDVTPPTVRMIERGITLALDAHQKEVWQWEADAMDAKAVFMMETNKTPPGTPAETRSFLVEVLPPEVIDRWPRTAKTGELTTEGAELKRHVDVPAIRALLALNATLKLHSTFGPELANKVSARTGRLHPGFKIASTKAGRFSCSDPNIQQIPKHKAPGLRGCFIAESGKVLVICDYNAMELRAAAEVSDDTAMRADFANGVDLHRRQASETLGIPQEEVTKDQRDAAKPICFGTIYGAGRRGLMASAWGGYGVLLPEDKAETDRRAFLARYPDLARWMDRSHEQSNEQGHIAIGRLGRVIEAAWEAPKLPDGSYNYHCDEDTDDLFDLHDDGETELARPLPWKTELKRTLCCNAPIQGACADAAMRALIGVDAALRAAKIDGGVVLFVHDELVIEAPEADADYVKDIVTRAMTRAFSETFPEAPLNGLVETRVATAWGPRDERDTVVEPVAGDAGGADLPAGGIPRPEDGGEVVAPETVRRRTRGRRPGTGRPVDVPAPGSDLKDAEAEKQAALEKWQAELSATLLARVCDRCGSSPCMVFGETATFCTLECWQASLTGVPESHNDAASDL
jgi:DNA polymerase-1